MVGVWIGCVQEKQIKKPPCPPKEGSGTPIVLIDFIFSELFVHELRINSEGVQYRESDK